MAREYFEPTATEKASAEFLIKELEELIRIPLGKPLTISSGARSSNYASYLRSNGIKAALNGAHNQWRAVDLLPPREMTQKEFWDFCDKRWPGRMERWEYTQGNKSDPRDGWVHLDIGFDKSDWGKRLRFIP